MLGLAIAVWVVIRSVYVNWPADALVSDRDAPILAVEEAPTENGAEAIQKKRTASVTAFASAAATSPLSHWYAAKLTRNDFVPVGPRGSFDSQVPAAIERINRFDNVRAIETSPSGGEPRILAEAGSSEPVEPRSRETRVAAPTDRWSFDGWVHWRQGSDSSAASGVIAPGYGRSQAGGILRYALAQQSASAFQAFVRVSSAFEQRDADIAAGVSAKPIPSLPVRAHAELRYTRFEDGSAWRPAAYATTGFDDVALPFDTILRGYAAAGYVAGEAATPFVDGQLVASRRLTSPGPTSLFIGVGAWGGAQDGVERLDVGPSAALAFPIAEGTARLSVDYRQRVMGNAAPSSGVAATLATSF